MFDLFKKKLKREELLTIVDWFTNEIKKYEIFKIPDELYLSCFDKLEYLLNNRKCLEDNRFVTYGRLDFLQEELVLRLNDEGLRYEEDNWKEKWDNRLGAFWDLYDYIYGIRFFKKFQVPDNLDYKSILKANDEYYKEGFICKQERDILLDMINKIKEFLKNRKKYDIKPEDNVPQEVYGPPEYFNKKYEIEPKDNVAQCVYGPPEYFKKKSEEPNKKYDIKPENNMPQRVYGIPDFKKNNKKEDA